MRTTDFVPEEGGHPIYGADNLADPWSNPQLQRIQAAFHPVAAIDLPYWSASGMSDVNGTFPLPSAVGGYAYNTPVTRNITVFNDDFTNTSVGLTWTARLDQPNGTVIVSGTANLNVPLGSRVTQPVTFTTPGSGSRVHLTLSTTKSGVTLFTDAVEYFNLGAGGSVDDADARVTYSAGWSHAGGESGPYGGTNSYSDVAGSTATMAFTGTRVVLRAVTDPGHGIVGVSVDGGTETLVDEYSATRTGDVAVWTSPQLTSGNHTVRVRATGTQRAGATHNWATVDRFEVTTASGGAGPGFYSDINYGGTAVTLGVGNYDLAQLQSAGIANDSISSLRVPSGYTITAYQNGGFSSTAWTFTADTPSLLGTGNNDAISSMRITRD